MPIVPLNPQPIGKIGMRFRGEYYHAFYILNEHETELIRVPAKSMESSSSGMIRDALIDAARLMVGDIIFKATGVRPSWPNEPVKASDSEREK